MVKMRWKYFLLVFSNCRTLVQIILSRYRLSSANQEWLDKMEIYVDCSQSPPSLQIRQQQRGNSQQQTRAGTIYTGTSENLKPTKVSTREVTNNRLSNSKENTELLVTTSGLGEVVRGAYRSNYLMRWHRQDSVSPRARFRYRTVWETTAKSVEDQATNTVGSQSLYWRILSFIVNVLL